MLRVLLQSMLGYWGNQLLLWHKLPKTKPGPPTDAGCNVSTEHQQLLTCTISLSASFPREEILMSSPSSSTMAAEKRKKYHFFAFNQSRLTLVVLILTVELCLADSNDDDRHGKFSRLQEKSNLSNIIVLSEESG